MLRRSICLAIDAYSARQSKTARLLAAHKTAAELNRVVREHLRQLPRRARSAFIFEMVEVCRKQDLWMQSTVVLTAAASEGITMKLPWCTATLEMVERRGTPRDVLLVRRSLQQFARRLPATQRRSPGEQNQPDIAENADAISVVGIEPTGTAAQLLSIAQPPDVLALSTCSTPRSLSRTSPALDEVLSHLPVVRNDPDKLAALTEALHRRPPRVVRINANRAFWPLVRAEASTTKGLRAIPWYPNNLAWQIDETASADDRLIASHWMRAAVEARHAFYQSPSSLLPVLALGHGRRPSLVLDMCAAPGSKTRQLCELVSGVVDGCSNDMGLVVATDRDAKRVRELYANLTEAISAVVAQGDAEELSVPPTSDDGYDAVLLDAPCSGEGTLYKHPESAARWSLNAVARHHETQIRLLMAATRLARPGASIVYSTCTVNPYENEAVVAAVLRKCHGTLRLVPVPAQLTRSEVTRTGFTSWWTPTELRRLASSTACSARETDAAPTDLSLCRRVTPFAIQSSPPRMDAFFIAKFEKARGPDRQQRRLFSVGAHLAGSNHLRGVCPVERSDAILADILAVFGIAPASLPNDLVFARKQSSEYGSTSTEYDLCAVSRSALEIASHWQPPNGIFHIGASVVAHVKPRDVCITDWRLTHRGAELLRPWASKRVLHTPLGLCSKLLATMDATLRDAKDPLPRLQNKLDPRLDARHRDWAAQLAGLGEGPLIITTSHGASPECLALAAFVVGEPLSVELMPLGANEKSGLVRCISSLLANGLHAERGERRERDSPRLAAEHRVVDLGSEQASSSVNRPWSAALNSTTSRRLDNKRGHPTNVSQLYPNKEL